MIMKKVVLAYSGGLDSSVIIKWLTLKGCKVIAFLADVGQGEDLKKAQKKALKVGAVKACIADLRKEFVEDFIFEAIKANAVYEGRYLLGTSLARPLIAKKQIEIARAEKTKFVAHGATGKGNDQVRFELAYLTLMPDVTIVSPWKDPEFLAQFQGRGDMMAFAKKHGIPVSATKKSPYSCDANIMHISYESGILEDITRTLPEKEYRMTVSPKRAPEKETVLEISFKSGVPVAVKNISKGRKITGPLKLYSYLNDVAGANGVGRIDIVESRFVGMKSRGVYETPAGTVLMAAHRDLETLTMDREVMKIRDGLIPKFSELVYNGFWLSPEMNMLRKMNDEAQKHVTGKVKLSLYKGNCVVLGRSSPFSLYDEKSASMDEHGGYDQTDAKGFIKLNALRLKASVERAKKHD